MEKKKKFLDDYKKDQEEGDYRGICPICMYYCPYYYMLMTMNQSMTSSFPGMMSQRSEMNMRQQPCDGFLYTVQRGDSLYSIAQNYKVTLNDLLEANPQITNPNAITIGQTICVPGVMPLPTPVECDGEIYTVRAGDTLFAISQMFNVTVSAILAANPLITDPNNINVGLRICIPNGCSGRIYTVRRGDTLAGIAQNFGVSYQALLRANPQITDPNQIFIGQNICIPADF